MRSKSRLPIVMATDDQYACQTSVAIYSLVKNLDAHEEITILILHGDELSDKGKQIIQNSNIQSEKVEICYQHIEKDVFQEYVQRGYISKATMYRLLLPQLLQEYDSCLYVDSDLVVVSDISKLFNVELEDYYVAGVKDWLWGAHTRDYIHLEIPDMSQYINAGVLLMNLKKLRNDHMQELFMRDVDKNFPLADQDIINRNCYGHILILPLRYNVFSCFFNKKKEVEERLNETYLNWREELAETDIIHFSSDIKPWNCTRCCKNNVWWEYARQVLSDKCLDELYKEAEEITSLRDMKNVMQTIEGERNIVVWGYSFYGKIIAQKIGENRVCAFGDNDDEKIGQKWNEICVLSIDEILEKIPNPFFVIASQKSWKDVREHLISLGIEKERMVRYIYKSERYYIMLDHEYYQYEREDAQDSTVC